MNRISAPLTDTGYQAANAAFQKQWSGDHEELLTFIKRHCPSNYGGCPMHILSIGAGDGQRDLAALDVIHNACQPSAIHFTAIEPNGSQLDALANRFNDQADITSLTLLQQTAEAYDFPTNTFDLILYTHSLYHMPGAEQRLLRDSVTALTPDGRIIVALSTEKGGIFQMMNHFWQTIDYSHFEQGNGLFGQESLLALLEDNYNTDQYIFQAVPDVYIDVRDILDTQSNSGENLLNFILQSDTSKLPEQICEEAKSTLEDLTTHDPSGGHRLPHGSGLFVIFADE